MSERSSCQVPKCGHDIPKCGHDIPKCGHDIAGGPAPPNDMMTVLT